MKGWKKGWKVLSRRSKHLYSAMVHVPIAKTRYIIGKKTFPRSGCGPLAVFKTEQQAQAFIFHEHWVQSPCIRPCLYKPSKKTTLWFPPYRQEPGNVKPLTNTPAGTVFATQVIVLPKREIEWRKDT